MYVFIYLVNFIHIDVFKMSSGTKLLDTISIFILSMRIGIFGFIIFL